jgi:hypothetical protein
MTPGSNFSQRMHNRHLFHDIRVLVSGCAALLASLLCHNLGHFTLVLSQPSTWYQATQHRCGEILIAAVIWFSLETVSRIYSAVSLRQPTTTYLS